MTSPFSQFDRPSRSISVVLDDETLDRLDALRRASPDLPSRSALVRELVGLGLDLHDDPIVTLTALVKGMAETAAAVAEADALLEEIRLDTLRHSARSGSA